MLVLIDVVRRASFFDDHGDDGDTYDGKCASGHQVANKEFVIFLSYFDFSRLEPEDRIQTREKVGRIFAVTSPNQ